jgi:drug/metabolite transporter (DMT)-like permease
MPIAGSPRMLTFVALCLLSRVAYSFNDVLVGELARRHDRMEIATWRGLSLGVTMAPLLVWVSGSAWEALAAHPGELLWLVTITAGANVLQLQAARYLPFGLRAALFVAGVALGGLALGAWFLDERFSLTQLGWCALVIASAVLASLGNHSGGGLTADVRKGAPLALAASALIAAAALSFARLARATDPLLVAWAWELGAGAVLVVPLLWRQRGRWEAGVWPRFVRTAACSLPTVVGTAASAVAVTLGPLGVWAALAGTQAVFTAGLGAAWHRERIGPLRWFYFALGALGVSGLALARHPP